jgi:hypothetical protein
MKIKPPKKRIEFERILKKLGYKDQSPILLDKAKKVEYPILKELSGDQFTIFYFTIPYYTKKTYLYKFFIDNYEKLNTNELENELKILSKNIIFTEKTRVCEIGWGIHNSFKLLFCSKKHLKQIYFEIIKKTKREFLHGDGILFPQKGDILVSKPDGGKLLGSKDPRRFERGKNQRGLINTKFGFGPIKDHNSQYARYDEDLNPKPI